MMERIRQTLKKPPLRARLLMALAALAACALLLGAQGEQGGMTSEEKRLSRALSSVSGAGNVRVTLDSHIRTALRSTDFLNPHCATVPVPDSPCILEVKWDNYLPDAIRDMVQLGDRCSSAYSKYAACRMYD